MVSQPGFAAQRAFGQHANQPSGASVGVIEAATAWGQLPADNTDEKGRTESGRK